MISELSSAKLSADLIKLIRVSVESRPFAYVLNFVSLIDDTAMDETMNETPAMK